LLVEVYVMKFEATREVSFIRVLGRPYADVLR
jgi:hypothetical protein